MHKLFLAVSLLLTAPAIGAELTPAQIFRAASPSIVVVETYDEAGNPVAQGSGVSVLKQQVVTNCHVFKNATSAKVIYLARSLAASLLLSDRERDLCTLQVPGLTAPAAKLGRSVALQVGDKAYAIGAPQGFTLTLTDGLISSVRPVSGGNVLQTSAAISPGSSGGGLFNSRAELVGITTLYFKDSPQLNFAVPVEWIYELPERSKMQFEASANVPNIEAAQGEAALNSLGTTLKLLDPIGYERRRPELERMVVEIGQSLPPTQWEDATRRAYLSIIERENEMRTAADKAAATGDESSAAVAEEATAAQAAADEAAMASDPSAAEHGSDPPKILAVRIGRRNDSKTDLVENSVFIPRDTVHAEVETTGGQQQLQVRWTFGKEKQLVLQQTKTVSPGRWTTDFQIDKPDGWPVGTYEVTVSINGQDDLSKFFCVEDAKSICREVLGHVYSYVKGGMRTYSSVPPPPNAKNVRTIRYSFFEVSWR